MSHIATEAPQSPLASAERKIDVGEVLTRTFHALGQAPWAFAGLTLVPLVLALPALFVGDQPAGHVSTLMTISGALLIVQSIVEIVFQSATTVATGQLIVGGPFDPRVALGTGFRRFVPFLVAGLVAGLVILLGLVIFIVPGVIAACAFALIGPACIIERRGPIDALKRSAFLTKGNRWRIIGAFLVMTIVPSILLSIVAGIASVLLSLLHLEWLGGVLFLMTGPLVSTGCLVMLTVIFFELRGIKEGIGPLESVARVFD